MRLKYWAVSKAFCIPSLEYHTNTAQIAKGKVTNNAVCLSIHEP